MCTKADHQAVREQPGPLGPPQLDETGAVLFYLRNCERCGTTLAVEPPQLEPNVLAQPSR